MIFFEDLFLKVPFSNNMLKILHYTYFVVQFKINWHFMTWHWLLYCDIDMMRRFPNFFWWWNDAPGYLFSICIMNTSILIFLLHVLWTHGMVMMSMEDFSRISIPSFKEIIAHLWPCQGSPVCCALQWQVAM